MLIKKYMINLLLKVYYNLNKNILYIVNYSTCIYSITYWILMVCAQIIKYTKIPLSFYKVFDK
uniref:Uncharacterized protein n=1 Tax=Physcomitrium patens TaxID=3218 RepID=A0A2K1INQ3_PHYPA|nr:hypothetical protein PHYPA_027227 [Physcomitrium patens]